MSNDMETVTLSLETYERFKENAKLLDKMKEHPDCIFTKGTMSSYNLCGISYEESFNYQGKDEVLAEMQEMLDNQKKKIDEQKKEIKSLKKIIEKAEFLFCEPLTKQEIKTKNINDRSVHLYD